MIIREKFQNNLEIDKVILSINTTGINRHKNSIFLINIILCGPHGEIYQIYLNKDDYSQDLKYFHKLIEDKRIINYNGNSFDIPFINKYLIKNKLPIIQGNSFDLFQFLKNYKLLDIKSYNLKYIYEKFTNKNYEIIEQKEIIKLYKNHLLNNDEESLKLILNEGKLSVIYRYNIKESLNKYSNNNAVEFEIFDDLFKALPYSYAIKGDFINIKLLNLSSINYELNIQNKYFSIKSNNEYFYLKYRLVTGLIQENINAICIIYPDILNIKNIYNNINDKLIPIIVKDQVNIPFIINITKDSLLNLKNYAYA